MTLTKENIIEILKKITYPGFSRDIVSFGMLKDITITKDSIDIILTQSTKDVGVLNEIKEKIIKEISFSYKENENIINIHYHSTDSLKGEGTNTGKTDKIKHIIAIASGKGGVGKSTVAINIASELSKSFKVGLLDLDIYGPSLPTLIGEKKVPKIKENNLLVPIEKFGMKFMSFGFLNSNDDPAIWRGPMVSKLTNQFFDNVDWGELDYLILDLPPGTGDIQLTLVQKIALTGAIIITTPQDLAHKDVQKGSDMFKKVNTPVIGIIENMSYYSLRGKLDEFKGNSTSLKIEGIHNKIKVDKTGLFSTKIEIFQGKSALTESKRLNIPLLGSIPLDPTISLLSDMGTPCVFEKSCKSITEVFSEISNKITNVIAKQNVS